MFTTSNTNSSSCPASNLSEYVSDDFSGILSVIHRLHFYMVLIIFPFSMKIHCTYWNGMVCHIQKSSIAILYWDKISGEHTCMIFISIKLDEHIGICTRSKLSASDHMDMVGRHSSWKVKVNVMNRHIIQYSYHLYSGNKSQALTVLNFKE